jgi:hypothetical protein
MITLAEVAAWTVPEIAARIYSILPADWEFIRGVTPDGIPSAEFKDSGFVIWQDTHLDERLLMLNAFGWVFTKRPTMRHPAWIRGSIPGGTPHVAASAPHLAPTDPEDLDPAEIESVYGAPESK